MVAPAVKHWLTTTMACNVSLFCLYILFPLRAQAVADKNPFLGNEDSFYVNPGNSKQFDSSVKTASGKVKENLLEMQKVPSAYWIDVADKIHGKDMKHMEGILTDAASKNPPQLVVLIWYDLPNRDCDAKASNGEICCYYTPEKTCDYMKTGDCKEGIAEYKTKYVDPFVEVLAAFEDNLPIVVIMEPDSLPNLATNTGHPKCGNPATKAAYKQGVQYALEQVTSKAPGVTVYLDAAHGGWVGWENNLMKFVNMLKDMNLPLERVRGFATNVANYQPLGVQCPWCPDAGYRNGFCLNGKHQSHPCCSDPCKLSSQYNFGNNELNYAAGLVAAANGELGMDAHVIIDTGRNGITDQRQDCANWCNPRGSGAGIKSTTKTANTSLVDAYYWLKTPGESDGCSETLPSGSKCPRFDAGCASPDSLGARPTEKPAPEAGHWYDFQVKQLAENACFAGSPDEIKAMASSTDETCEANGQPQQPQPAQQPKQPQQQPAPAPSPPGGDNCGEAFSQCGGTSWSGPFCCQRGCQCMNNTASYSQCVPQVAGTACTPSSRGAGLPTLPPQTVVTMPTLSPEPAPMPTPSAQFSPIPTGAFLEFLGKDCYGDGQHNAYGGTGDPSTCMSLCYHRHQDCTAVIIWRTSCFFRTQKDCVSKLSDAIDHKAYILKARSTGASPGHVPAPAPRPAPANQGTHAVSQSPSPGAGSAKGTFQTLSGMDCFGGNNAYGKVSRPETCKQECLALPDCTAAVKWGGLCFFRNNALCSQNLVGSPDHTTYLRVNQQTAPQPVQVAASEEQQFEAIPEHDCFGDGKHNSYHRIGEPSTCKSECLHNYPDCVAVIIWSEKNMCFFRNQPACKANAQSAPKHTLFIKKTAASNTILMQKDELLPRESVGDMIISDDVPTTPRNIAWLRRVALASSLVAAAALSAAVLQSTVAFARRRLMVRHHHGIETEETADMPLVSLRSNAVVVEEETAELA